MPEPTPFDMEQFAVTLTDQCRTHEEWLAVIRYGLGTLLENPALFIEIIWRQAVKMQETHQIKGRVLADDVRQIFQELSLKIVSN